MKNNRLTGTEIEEIKIKIRQPINPKRQNSEDTIVRLENLAPEQVENTIGQVRQGSDINNINQPSQQEEQFEENEIFVVENKERNGEIKTEMLEEFFKTQNMNIKEQEPLLKLKPWL